MMVGVFKGAPAPIVSVSDQNVFIPLTRFQIEFDLFRGPALGQFIDLRGVGEVESGHRFGVVN
ncbi:hypothetical protein EBT31_08030 [bacterium]|nr:hypothetical protein [bacterium]